MARESSAEGKEADFHLPEVEIEDTASTARVSSDLSEIPIVADLDSTGGEGNTYRHGFESTLFAARPYRRTSEGSAISLPSFERPTRRWSHISGGSNTAVLSLPTSAPGTPKIGLLDRRESSLYLEVVDSPLHGAGTGFHTPGSVVEYSWITPPSTPNLPITAAWDGQAEMVDKWEGRVVYKDAEGTHLDIPFNEAPLAHTI